MNKRIFELFDYGDEIALVEERDGLFDPARIKELTMKKINAENTRAQARHAAKRARPVYRTVLIAAVITALLAGTAFAVTQMGLRELVLTERDDGYVNVSVLGWRDTPEYRAFAEWDAYVTEYNSTHEIPHNDDPDIPVSYLSVGAWSQEMADTLDGILATYGLVMHDSRTVTLPAEGSGIDTDVILTGDVAGVCGYAYSDGTLKLEVTQTLSNGEAAEYKLFSAVKGKFSRVSSGMDSEYEEWTYTAADGTEVILVMGASQSMIVADMENVFVTAGSVFRSISDRALLEELADSISWKALNACKGFSDAYYEAFAAEQEAEAEEYARAEAAEWELSDWVLSDEIIRDHYPEATGCSSEESEDGTAWVEWTYTALEGEGVIRVRYERPAGDIETVFSEMLERSGMADRTAVISAPVYIRTETAEGPEIETEYRDFTVYIGEAADGSVSALWLDGDKALIFTLSADPGELTRDELEAQIAHLISGLGPFPTEVEPEVVWARLGRYEPTWLPEGWYLNDITGMVLAVAMDVDGAWFGYYSQAYITGEIGKIMHFSYETAEPGATPRTALAEEWVYDEEELEDLGITLTDMEVNGHPALMKEAFNAAFLLWIDEDAGVLFNLSGDDAETVLAVARSVALR